MLRAPLFAAIVFMLLLVSSEASAQSRFCAPLGPPSEPIVRVTNARQLSNALSAARPGATILLADGTYTIDTLPLRTQGVTLRSASGNRDRVVLDGRYQAGNMLSVDAANITIADLTLKRSRWHPIHVISGGRGVRLHNLRIVDGGQQFVKVNASEPSTYADNGTVSCSAFELTNEGRRYVEAHPASLALGCYTGGVDALQVRGWVVRDSSFKGFYCTNGHLSQHAVHFWVTSRDALVERNVFINNARAVGFGLGPSAGAASTAAVRPYDDLTARAGFEGFDSFGGIIRNNFIYADIQAFDTGIGLESADGATVAHNTVVAPRGLLIDARFPSTRATIQNNLLSAPISIRSDARVTQAGNVVTATPAWFVDAKAGNLRLRPNAPGAIDRGTSGAGNVSTDIDGDRRDERPDAGADEVTGARWSAPMPAGENPTTPAFRADVHSVPIEFSVFSGIFGIRRPVRDFKPADITIVLEGKTFPIAALTQDRPGYYIASFTPPDEYRNGKTYQITIKVRNRDWFSRTITVPTSETTPAGP